MESANRFPKVVAFDVDGTLVEVGHDIPLKLGVLLQELVKVAQVAIISGRSLHEIDKVLATMSLDENFKGNLFALPACGASLHAYDEGWSEIYMHAMSEDEHQHIEGVLHEHALDSAHLSKEGLYMPRIINRGSAITLVAFDHELSPEEKRAWDPTREKREALKSIIEPLLPSHTVTIGGLGSLDITQKGVDKGYGVRELAKHLSIKEEEIIFVGDMLFPGGNDYPVTQTDARTISVTGPEDTIKFVEGLLGKF